LLVGNWTLRVWRLGSDLRGQRGCVLVVVVVVGEFGELCVVGAGEEIEREVGVEVEAEVARLDS
jgi:hypothetical protein